MKELLKKIKGLPIKRSYLLFIFIISIITTISIGTFAMFTSTSVSSGNIITITTPETIDISLSNITEYKKITISSGKYKTIKFNITNDLSSSVYYGVWYEMVDPTTKGSNTTIAKLNTSTNETSGSINASATKDVTIIIINNESSDITINLGVASNNTNELDLSTGRSLITGEASEFNDFGYTTTGMDLSSGKKYVLSSYTCKNGATVTYDSDSITVTYSKPDNCKLNFSKSSYINEYINESIKEMALGSNSLPSLNNGEEGTLENGSFIVVHHPSTTQVTSDTYSYRYVGSDPSNYLTFNGELWRIIGVTYEYTGSSYEYVTKIIRNEPYLTSTAFGDNNDWVNASLNSTFNDTYYNTMSQTTKNQIQSVKWYLGSYTASTSNVFYTYYTKTFYNIQRSTSVQSGNSTNWTGNIGLIYLDDYGYTAGKQCVDGTSVGSYWEGCGNNAWLKKETRQWTLLPSTNSFIANINEDGGIGQWNIWPYTKGYSATPVLYLKSSVIFKGGSGILSDPYIIQ